MLVRARHPRRLSGAGSLVPRAGLTAILALPALLLSACAAQKMAEPVVARAARPASAPGPAASPAPAEPSPAIIPALRAPVPPAPAPPPATISVLGPGQQASIPASTAQVVVVDAATSRSAVSVVTEWDKTATGWHQQGPAIPAHNGYAGWSAHRHSGDGTSPVGMFTLTSAGGRLPSPGTRLPYEHRPVYYDVSGTFLGGNLAGSFDYVVAINYNRVASAPPSDPRLPEGPAPGGGIWFHVDHHSPTHGCVSLPLAQMRALLQWLNPADHPVVVMGPQSWLSGPAPAAP